MGNQEKNRFAWKQTEKRARKGEKKEAQDMLKHVKFGLLSRHQSGDAERWLSTPMWGSEEVKPRNVTVTTNALIALTLYQVLL